MAKSRKSKECEREELSCKSRNNSPEKEQGSAWLAVKRQEAL